jgi:hypothetical protein
VLSEKVDWARRPLATGEDSHARSAKGGLPQCHTTHEEACGRGCGGWMCKCDYSALATGADRNRMRRRKTVAGRRWICGGVSGGGLGLWSRRAVTASPFVGEGEFVACAREDQRSRVASRLSRGAIGREVEGEWNGPVPLDPKRGVGKNCGDVGERGCSYASCFNI